VVEGDAACVVVALDVVDGSAVVVGFAVDAEPEPDDVVGVLTADVLVGVSLELPLCVAMTETTKSTNANVSGTTIHHRRHQPNCGSSSLNDGPGGSGEPGMVMPSSLELASGFFSPHHSPSAYRRPRARPSRERPTGGAPPTVAAAGGGRATWTRVGRSARRSQH
jgi:hypothetical protein